MGTIVIVALGVALVAFLFFRSAGTIDGAEAKRRVAEGALLLDVRTEAEFSSGHVTGALNVPVQNLAERLAELGPKARPIVVYCRSGARSGRAARMLKEKGYEVFDLGAGSRWPDP